MDAIYFPDIIGTLCVIFSTALIILTILCRLKFLQQTTYQYMQKLSSRKTRLSVHLIDSGEVELGEVCVHPEIEQILENEKWVHDATGLIPHCLAVLKLCHHLTNKVATLAMSHISHQDSKCFTQEIVQIARKITPRADDVVRSMYPPLDICLLEARAVALVLAVTHLAMVSKHALVKNKTKLTWIDQALSEMDSHLQVLREAALSQEATNRLEHLVPLANFL